MRYLRAIIFLVLSAFAISSFAPGGQSQQPSPGVDLKVVKYDDLCNFVLANKGKVILLDIWATNCPPCKASFFHTVDLDKAYRDKGLVVASITPTAFERQEPAQLKPRALKFLDSQNAKFTNLILDEPEQVVKDKLRLVSLPCLYVFNREGKWTQFIGSQLEEDADHRHPFVEQYIKSLLEQPATKN